MAKKKKDEEFLEEPFYQNAEEYLSLSYLSYAIHTIKERALTSYDGFKPATARLVYSMYEMGATPDKPFVKAARVVGNTLKFHPHGTASLEGTIAKMAQEFTSRVPLVDYYGSVGKYEGDKPAGVRYWEAKLSPAGMEVVKEVKEGAVEMVDNYDSKEKIPKVMPSRFPVSIINGNKGLAVGFASRIPEHNPTETMKAIELLIKKPNATVDEVLKVMPGPDFCAGGEIFGIDGIKSYFTNGSGSFIVRGKFYVESLSQGRSRIVFTELPPDISAENIISQVQALQVDKETTVKGKKVIVPADKDLTRGIKSIKDLSDKDKGFRLVIETTKGFDHRRLLGILFKKTSLESPYSVIMTVLNNGVPSLLGVVDVLKDFIEFRRGCVVNKLNYRLEKIDDKLSKIETLLVALLDIDKCIKIIRKSESTNSARDGLMKAFKFNGEQADYILSMQLRSLTKADKNTLESTKYDLEKEKEQIKLALSSQKETDKILLKEVRETAKVIKDNRRATIHGVTVSEFSEEVEEEAEEAKGLAEGVKCFLTRFSDGSVLVEEEGAKTKKVLPPMLERIELKTNDTVVFVSEDGIGRKAPISFAGRNRRVFLKDIFPEANSNHISGVSKLSGNGLAIMTTKGKVKISKSDYPVNLDVFPVISLEDGDKISGCRWIENEDSGVFASVSNLGKIILFKRGEVNPTGFKAKGVNGMNVKKGEVIYFDFIKDSELGEKQLLTASDRTFKRAMLSEYPVNGRGGLGVATQNFAKGEDSLQSATISSDPSIVFIDGDTFSDVSLPPLKAKNTVGEKNFLPLLDFILGSKKI